MNILFFSDLHGSIKNIDHLIDADEYDHYIFAGDFFGYFILRDETLQKLQNLNLDYVIGNHDLYFIRELMGDAFEDEYSRYSSDLVSAQDYQETYGALNETCHTIDPHLVGPLFGQPLLKHIIVDNLRITICHGSPYDPANEYIYPDYPDFNDLLEQFAFDILVLGHTHKPIVKEYEGRYIINPGSCTLPRGTGAEPTVIACDTKTLLFKLIPLKQKVLFERLINSKVIEF